MDGPAPSIITGPKGDSPEELMQFLEAIINTDLKGTKPIPKDEKKAWVTLVLELSEHFLASFPLSGAGIWSTYSEKTKLSLASLEVIQGSASKVPDFLPVHEEDTHIIIARVLAFTFAVASWNQSHSEPCGPPELCPRSVHLKAVGTFEEVVRCLKVIQVPDRGPTQFVEQCLEGIASCMKNSMVDPKSASLLQKFEPIVLNEGKSPVGFRTEVDSAFHFGLSMSDLVFFASCLCSSDIISFPAKLTYYRELCTFTRQLVELLLTQSLIIPSRMRSEALSIVLRAWTHLSTLQGYVSDMVNVIPTTVLLVRLQEGPNADWDATDRELLSIFNKGLTIVPLFNHQVVLRIADQESWGEDGESLRELLYSSLDSLVPFLDNTLLQSLSQSLAKKPERSGLKEIKGKIQERLDQSGPVLGKRKRDDESWKSEVVKLLESDVYHGPSGSQSSDHMPEPAWISRVLDTLKQKFSLALDNKSKACRLQALKALHKLPCMLSHPDEHDCPQHSAKPAISLIPCYLTCLTKLLAGPETEVDISVRKNGQDVMATCLRHHSKGYGEDHLDAVVEFIKGGMEHEERCIRLAAGRALVELVRLYLGIGRGASRRIDSVFDHVILLDAKRDAIRETTLISLGLIGRLQDADILGRVIGRLLLQLGGSNMLLKGVAYCQILSLAKHHNKTPYLLLSPYLSSLAPMIVSSLVLQPNLLTETCRFLSLSPSDFLSVTLSHTLPRLFATCNAEALRKLSAEVKQPVSNLFLNESPHILAHIFSLSGSAETEKSLNFITRTLNEATNGSTKIGIQNVVKSCLIPLLGLLIISMGDESKLVAENAAAAITKVERSLTALSGVPKKRATQHLGNFLKDYTLGIITNLSDVLQDVQGRKNEATKRSVLRGFALLIREVGPPINTVAPQIMATLQTTVNVPPLSEVALRTWYDFLVTLDVQDLGPHVGPTTATLVHVWPLLSAQSREIAKKCTTYIASDVVKSLGDYVDEIADLSSISDLSDCANKVLAFRLRRSARELLDRILDRCSSDNVTVVRQALEELRTFMTAQQEGFIRELASGDVFDPMVGEVMRSLLSIACRDGEGVDLIRPLAFDCIGIIGAVDPDRFDLPADDPHMVVLNNFMDESEAMQFAVHLIENGLVGAFRSTSDIKYQSHLAFAIQELLKFCKFTSDLISNGTPVSNKVRNRWNQLPKHVLETVTPLLQAKFAVQRPSATVNVLHPIYHGQSTYREWIQTWCTHLVSRANGRLANAIFGVFRAVLRNRDVGIAHQLLPHLVLNILISGDDEDTRNIQLEIAAVLQDQLDPASTSSSDKKLLSSQVIFLLMDHLNKWIRRVRQEISTRRNETKRSRQSLSLDDLDMQLTRVDSILANIDQDLIAKAAFQCRSFARALMNFEKQILLLRERGASQETLEAYYEKLHEIYAHLDEPDGMEGISTFITFPSIEHQIRQHENTGKWTSAQSCWELRVQQSPDELQNHLGLLRCLRNLGHYDSLRTHIQGVVVRYPRLEPALVGFKIEGLLMNNDWDNVQGAVSSVQVDIWESAMARLLLAMRSKDDSSFAGALSSARLLFGSEISAAGEWGYRRAYDSVLKLHLVHDIEMIHHAITINNDTASGESKLSSLFQKLNSRLESTLPTFRTREPILSMHRTTFSLNQSSSMLFKHAIGQSWLESSKIARKAGHWQTAYSAVLQAQESKAPFSFVQMVKLSKASGDPLRALYDLEHALKGLKEKRANEAIDLEVNNIDELKRLEAKAKLLRVRWMRDSDRYDTNVVANELSNLARSLRGMESAHFHSGHFQDNCYKALGPMDKKDRGLKMAVFIIRAYASAIKAGNKYTFQTIPRLITLWLDIGEDSQMSQTEQFGTMNSEVHAAVQQIPVYKWLNAFPQIISRVDHKNKRSYDILANLISVVLQEYPRQTLWQFVAVVKSTKAKRERRGRDILDKLKSSSQNSGTRVPALVEQAEQMATELLNLCDMPIKDDNLKTFSLSKYCPALARLAPSEMIIPLQESMTPSLPPTSSSSNTHQPFPSDAPTIAKLFDEVEVMKSLARPRKITIEGSDGQIYMFLGKPKDDLRKDARLMDFNSMINKLLRSNSDSRRRRLHIRTYSVVTLNEECGFIQWVPNTMPIRPILVKYYQARGVDPYSREMGNVFSKIKELNDKDAVELYQQKISAIFPPLFHEWFLDTFPEPTAWLSSRLSYGRTAAVMSMVGFILGLGDRHLENILLDVMSGDAVHVDFNCLFEKGKTLETPERVPFRLTPNIVDALGVTGVEGTFRKCCEITFQLLRDNKDSLMSVLDAFIHDPLVEWEDEKRKLERANRSDRNAVKDSVDLRKLAKNALQPIERKLKGMYSKEAKRNDRRDKEITTSNLVQMLIEEATDKRNLLKAKMYPGWAPWH